MRMRLHTFLAILLVLMGTAVPAAAQLQLPEAGGAMPPVGEVVGNTTDLLEGTLEQTEQAARREARRLLRARDRTLSRLLRRNREFVERDANGDLARRGELIAVDLAPADQRALANAGFIATSSETIEGIDLTVTTLAVPQGMALADAEALALAVAPGAELTPDHLHLQSGVAASPPRTPISPVLPLATQARAPVSVEVGVIDGAPGSAIRVAGRRGFATGAPVASNHGSAVASLLANAGVSRIRVADVYGTDPAGGNALAISRALGWLTASGSKVITISLVGPRNLLVARAIASAQQRGIVIVAAVGNDGPAAPPAYPASYTGVVAVTGVDRNRRALIEAGRALHLDYAAPGDRVNALDARGRVRRWRGTSFATPLVAARIAAAMQSGGRWRQRVDAEAIDLGRRGPDETYGRGLLCGECGR